MTPMPPTSSEIGAMEATSRVRICVVLCMACLRNSSLLRIKKSSVPSRMLERYFRQTGIDIVYNKQGDRAVCRIAQKARLYRRIRQIEGQRIAPPGPNSASR